MEDNKSKLAERWLQNTHPVSISLRGYQIEFIEQNKDKISLSKEVQRMVEDLINQNNHQ